MQRAGRAQVAEDAGTGSELHKGRQHGFGCRKLERQEKPVPRWPLGKKPTLLGDGGCQGCSTASINGDFIRAGVTAPLPSTGHSPDCCRMKQGKHLQRIPQSGWAFLRSYFSFCGYILLSSTSVVCGFLEAPGFALPWADVGGLIRAHQPHAG